MDEKTQKAYQNLATEYSSDWLSQPVPQDMYDLINKFFIKSGVTADIGCGNGRDAYWMSLNGFKVVGFDSSKELLQIASDKFSTLNFKYAVLPGLNEISNSQFDNILCETVLMHLPKEFIASAVTNLIRVLKKEGILYLSWRVTEGQDLRHNDGRLYSAFSPDFITNFFDKKSILHFEEKISTSSGKRVCRLIYKNTN